MGMGGEIPEMWCLGRVFKGIINLRTIFKNFLRTLEEY